MVPRNESRFYVEWVRHTKTKAGRPTYRLVSGQQGRLWISCDTRRNAEIRGDVMRGVGDGHSSDDGKDNITLLEQRAISLEVLCLNGRPG